jgi:hypothetical protein
VTTLMQSHPAFAERVVQRVSARLGHRFSRRSFLVRTAVVGSALAVNPLRYLLRPGTAYASLCGPAADCGSGWTAMCCTINGGRNTCPPGSIPAGWWKVDNSGFCSGGPRYYIDCNSTCGPCGCGSSGICGPSCWTCGCHCASGTCDQRRVCCNEFRYGQCHQEVRCVGSVVCRVITCAPPWRFDPACTTASATSFATALHDAPCLHPAPTPHNAHIYAFGAAPYAGAPKGNLSAPIVGMDRSPSGRGYYLVGSDGGVFSFGDAGFFGSTGALRLNQPIVDLARTPSGRGYWLVATDGGVFCFGDAHFFGSTGGIRLKQPIVGMSATPSGRGYWLVASDGGVFCFGDAHFFGSTGAMRLNQPIVSMASTPTGRGYWLFAADGGVFCFGDAVFRGSLGGLRLRAPISGAAATPTGKGYWMVARDGGVFCVGDARFFGSLGASTAAKGPYVQLAARPQGDGYWIETST